MFSRTLRPGLTLGSYPEREQPAKGILDSVAHSASGLLRRLSRNQKKCAQQFCAQVNKASSHFEQLSRDALEQQAGKLRQSLARRGLNEELAVECFALVREAARQTLDQRHFDTQIIGGWVLLNGMLAEMETGEGKTLMATLPACTAAMAGIPVHVITANDYLVERDAELMAPVYTLLGLTVGTVTESKRDPGSRRNAYACDITYCTSKQVAFDYLRDRVSMGHRRGRLELQLGRLTAAEGEAEPLLLRGLCFAIVDEADSVLIDDAGTPLILSREVESMLDANTCIKALEIAGQLDESRDYRIHGRYSDVEMTGSGKQRLATLAHQLTRPGTSPSQSEFLIRQALRAQRCYQRDRDYLVSDGKVQIIDANTGRTMPDHSWEQGLHQLIEAREGCEITGGRETIARISYQRMFRRYLHLSGMTGTAREVAAELWSVYELEVIPVPTHAPVQRIAGRDRVYPTASAKWQAVVGRVRELHELQRPVLLGTPSVADSEHLSRLLHSQGLQHTVLNARQDRPEAEIVATAGQPGAITVATNMAGRGTDIHLAPQVTESGGLHVIAASRNEARRIDRQLFGRCGRQGDPGSFEAILSLEDDILKKYLLQSLINAVQACIRWGLPVPGRLFTGIAQRVAERHHARRRRSLIELDQRLKETLAFSGPQE
jgi:preprotein translocase subunit SecA